MTNRIREIRERLGLTQEQFGQAIGCTQGNVGHYERGQLLMPDRAGRLIEFAASRGLELTLDQVYGRVALPAPAQDSEAAIEPARVSTCAYTGPERRKAKA